MLEGAFRLHRVDQGRVFIRNAVGGRAIAFGVIEVPVAAPSERLVMARINSDLWLDLEHPVESRMDWNRLGECGISNVLTALDFRNHLLPDALDLFVRKSHLVHDDPSRRWDIVAGVAPRPLRCASVEGLYEIRPGGLAFTGVSQAQYVGAALLSIIRDPLWGPGGRFGLATDMDPRVAVEVIREDRERNMRRDREFAEYMNAISQAGPGLGMVYTAEERAAHEERIRPLVRELLVQQRTRELDELHRAVCERP